MNNVAIGESVTFDSPTVASQPLVNGTDNGKRVLSLYTKLPIPNRCFSVSGYTLTRNSYSASLYLYVRVQFSKIGILVLNIWWVG